MRMIELLDTSILLQLLRVPYESDSREEVEQGLGARTSAGVELFLPMASLVEAGGHVARIDNGHYRRESAIRLAKLIEATTSNVSPWRFSPLSWDEAILRELVTPGDSRLPTLVDSFAQEHLEMGDLLIVQEFRRFKENLDPAYTSVDVWTIDAALRATIDSLRR